MRWSPPEQNAQPPSFGLGPLPVSSTTPIRGILPGDVERAVQLVDGVRTERVAHLGAVEGDARDAAVLRHVRGDVGVGLGAGCRHPFVLVEQLGNAHPHSLRAAGAVTRDARLARPASAVLGVAPAQPRAHEVVVVVRAREAEREQAHAAVEQLVGDVFAAPLQLVGEDEVRRVAPLLLGPLLDDRRACAAALRGARSCARCRRGGRRAAGSSARPCRRS